MSGRDVTRAPDHGAPSRADGAAAPDGHGVLRHGADRSDEGARTAPRSSTPGPAQRPGPLDWSREAVYAVRLLAVVLGFYGTAGIAHLLGAGQ